MNYIAFDYGQKRIGTAISHNGDMALKLSFIKNDSSLDHTLKLMLEKYMIDQIVIGLPRAQDGKITRQGKYCLEFIEKVKSMFNLPVIIIEESLTTQMALRNLVDLGYNKVQILNQKDSESARIMLQEYLDNIDL